MKIKGRGGGSCLGKINNALWQRNFIPTKGTEKSSQITAEYLPLPVDLLQHCSELSYKEEAGW